MIKYAIIFAILTGCVGRVIRTGRHLRMYQVCDYTIKDIEHIKAIAIHKGLGLGCNMISMSFDGDYCLNVMCENNPSLGYEPNYLIVNGGV